MRRARNYVVAFLMCVVCTLLTMMSMDGMDGLRWLILSDINVAVWLFVAWLFDPHN